MIDPVSTVLSLPSTTADSRGGGGGAPSSSPSAAPAPTSTQAPATASAQPLRLVVEPIEGGDSFTYKLFDRATGELVMELPIEQATKMSDDPDYTAGQVINATA